MACSKYEYVKKFEQESILLPNTYVVIRIDGRGFHKFCESHNFEKPNDERAIHLMNRCASHVMELTTDVMLSYGQSDEYSFILKRDSTLFGRRASKIESSLVSLFASCFVFYWKDFFPDLSLKYPPCFDSRSVCYPTFENLYDYLCWRQVDCHINNLYNTTFWALVQQGGMSPLDAENKLKGTLSNTKNEILFTQFNINYNNLPAIFRKGSILIWKEVKEVVKTNPDGTSVSRTRRKPEAIYVDLISPEFWQTYFPDLAASPKFSTS